MASARNLCFTLNNYTEEEELAVQAWDCKYLVYGREVGEEGTPHLQGYVEWKGSKRFTTLKKMNPRIHWEKRRGTVDQAVTYCKKDGDIFEKGEKSEQGKRNDIEEVIEFVEAGASIQDIAEHYPKALVYHHNGIQRLIESRRTERQDPPEVIWVWGLAGVGKTRKYYVPEETYIKDGTQWWDGYEQQPTIIIDDFDGRWPYRDLLRLLDRYPYRGQVKGGYVKINSPRIVITCEFPPAHYYRETNELAQILRRLTLVEHLT